MRDNANQGQIRSSAARAWLLPTSSEGTPSPGTSLRDARSTACSAASASSRDSEPDVPWAFKSSVDGAPGTKQQDIAGCETPSDRPSTSALRPHKVNAFLSQARARA